MRTVVLALALVAGAARAANQPVEIKAVSPGVVFSVSATGGIVMSNAWTLTVTGVRVSNLWTLTATGGGMPVRDVTLWSVTTSGIGVTNLWTLTATGVPVRTLDVAGVSRTQTGMSNSAGDFVGAHSLLVGAIDSVSSYQVSVTNVLVELTPGVLPGCATVMIYNPSPGGNITIGGADLTSSGGWPIGMGNSLILNPVNRRTKIYAVRTGVTSATVAIVRF